MNKNLVLIGIMLFCIPAVLAVEYVIEYPSSVEPGTIFFVEHKFTNLTEGDPIHVKEILNDGVLLSAWDVSGSDFSQESYNKNGFILNWNLTALSDQLFLKIQFLSLEEREYHYWSKVTYPIGNKTFNKETRDVIDFIEEKPRAYDDINCVGEMFQCSDGSYVVTKKCVEGKQEMTGNTCPEPSYSALYWKIIATVFVIFMLGLILYNSSKKRLGDDPTKTSQ